MRLKKIAFIMALVLCLGSISHVHAEDLNEYSVKNSAGYETRWTNVVKAVTLLKGSGDKIIASAEVYSRNNTKVNGRLYLQKKRYGHWSTVKSWGIRGAGLIKLSKSYSGDAGKYRTKLFVNVEGEHITKYSSEKYIN